jgi:hypothetical protein
MPSELRDKMSTVDGWLESAEADRLFDLARDVREGCIVEVGSYRGRSTAALAFGARAGAGAPVYAIEPHETFTGVYGGNFGGPDRELFMANMIRLGLAGAIRLVNLSSEIVAPGWKIPVGLLWIDGDHRYEGVRRDMDCWRPHLLASATVVFDDAIDPDIGPARVIAELEAEGWRRGEVIGKTLSLAQPA